MSTPAVQVQVNTALQAPETTPDIDLAVTLPDDFALPALLTVVVAFNDGSSVTYSGTTLPGPVGGHQHKGTLTAQPQSV